MSRLLTQTEAAKLLGIAPGSLQNDRCSHSLAVPFVKIGRSVRYDEDALKAWLAERTFTPGAALGPKPKRAHWNYRVVEFAGVDGEKCRAIFEVHYDEEGQPRSRSESPATVGWFSSEGDQSPIAQLARMKEALSKQVLPDSLFEPK